MKAAPFFRAKTSSLSSPQPPIPPACFDYKAPMHVAGERIFHFQDAKVSPEFLNFEHAFVIQTDLIEENSQNMYSLEIVLRWEYMYGDTPPLEPSIFYLARMIAIEYFTENRFPPRFSSIHHVVRIHYPKAAPLHYCP